MAFYTTFFALFAVLKRRKMGRVLLPLCPRFEQR